MNAQPIGELPGPAAAAPSEPILPEQDPFYRPPRGLAKHAPGTVLRSRPVELALLGLVPQRISAWQLLFRSTNLRGRPEAAVTTVLLPWGADPAAARPVVSFQCAIDAVASKCLPSYAFRRGARALGAVPQYELLIIAHALTRGWAVSVPDHVGIAGHFGAPREPGYRTLDGLRATLAFLDLPPHTPVGLWGYSGGGLATVWAAESAAAYAPELDIAGAAVGSPVGDLESTFYRLNGSWFGGLATLCVAGLRRAYPDLAASLDEHLDQPSLALLERAERSTTVAILLGGRRSRIVSRNGTDLSELRTLPRVRAVLADLPPGDHPPAFPVLVVQGVHDLVIAVGNVDRLVDRYRAVGTPVRYVRDLLGGHITLGVLAAPLLENWLADRFAARPVAPGSTATVLSLALSAPAARGYLGLLGVTLAAVTGRPIAAIPISRRRRSADRGRSAPDSGADRS